MIGLAPLEIEIHPGEHPEGHLFGMTFNLDTIWVTVVAGTLLGILVDHAAGTTPVFTVLGVFVGMAVGAVGFALRVRAAVR